MGTMAFETKAVAEAIEKNGTPLQVASRQVLVENMNQARQALSRYGWHDNIFYSYKTNPVPEVLKVLHQNEAGAEVISERELNLALGLGVNPDRIVFNGIYKSPAALRTAVEKKIRCINVDAPQELDRLAELTAVAEGRIPVGLRIRPSVGWQGQFGYVVRDGSAYRMAQRISAHKGLDLKVIHFHLGGCLGFDTYRRALDETLGLVKKISSGLKVEIEALDVGGGFPGKDMRLLTIWEQGWLRLFDRPGPFRAADPEDGFRTLGKVAEYFDGVRKGHGLSRLSLWAEPGRLITGNAQILAVRVVGLRRSGRKDYAIVDGGRVGAAGPLVGETRKVSVWGKRGGSERNYDIVGPTCMPWDRLFAGIDLPELAIGDILVIEGAGAYFVPMETEFSFGKPQLTIIGE